MFYPNLFVTVGCLIHDTTHLELRIVAMLYAILLGRTLENYLMYKELDNYMKVFFVRHGQTNYNVLDLCNDDTTKDVHLTDLGKQQAEIVRNKIKNIDLDIVIISELPRTKETASIITKNHKVEFKIDSRINDRKTGFDSKPVSDFFKALEPDIFNLKFNDGESFQEEKKRVHSFLEELKLLNYGNVLVVAHSEILQIINGYYNNLSDQEMWNTKIDNCQVLEVDI